MSFETLFIGNEPAIRLGMFATPTLPQPTAPVRIRVPALLGDAWEPPRAEA